MNIIELLKRALEWNDPYEDMPDYGYLLEFLGLDPSTDDETVREYIEFEVAALDLGNEAEGDADE